MSAFLFNCVHLFFFQLSVGYVSKSFFSLSPVTLFQLSVGYVCLTC